MAAMIHTTEQYKLLVYHVRTCRLMYEATRSRCYHAAYTKSFAYLINARVNGQFTVMELRGPRIVSVVGNTENETTKEMIFKIAA